MPSSERRRMGWGLLLLAMLAALLIAAGIEDIRRREIANWKNAGIALLAPLWWAATGALDPSAIAIQLATSLVIFGLFCVAFHLGQMGGGDVKMIGALSLWMPVAPLLTMLLVMSIVGGVLTLLLVIERRVTRKTDVLEVPYGVAIAMAGLIALREPLLNQFT